MNELKDYIPYIIGTASTLIALKKDWFQAQFSRKKGNQELASTQEDIEEKALNNIEKQMQLYQAILDDTQKRHKEVVQELNEQMVNMKDEIKDLKDLLEDYKEELKKCETCPQKRAG